ncbi:hypothetical protein [Streptomyces sp. NPDC058466]|uniref:hypothetical protein n=1 Tax=unclassified Streptomyces TaxID=2593676 RepID=UPI0036628631
MVLFLLLVIVAMVLGIIGVAAEGLRYLLIVGIVVFAADLAIASLRWSRRAGRRRMR